MGTLVSNFLARLRNNLDDMLGNVSHFNTATLYSKASLPAVCQCRHRLRNNTDRWWLNSNWITFAHFNGCSVYSFSRSCPKTVSRTREVFPTGSTTLLRLQLWRTRDCAHRSRHVGSFFFFFFFWRERCLPKVSWKSNPAAPGLVNQVWPFKSALYVPGNTLTVGWGLLAHASGGHLRWSVEGWACLSSFQLKGLHDRNI